MPNGQGFVDYYALLGVAPAADAATIRAAFIDKAKQFHPDVGGSTETMQQFTRAYRTLMSQSSRRAYDLVHAFHTGTSELQYRDETGTAGSGAVSDMSDEEIDSFLDTIYAEYHNRPPAKRSFFAKIKNAL